MAKQDTFGWEGRIIDGKYRVDRAVDEGTFGVVYQAHHLKFDEKVALKCLKLPKGLQGPLLEEFSRRFLAEGRVLHRLSRTNVNIVQALDVGAELAPGGAWVPYLVLEWLEGISLAEDLERRASEGGRRLEDAMALLAPAALALAAAHEQRIAHCDVKPANLFLTEVAGRPTLKVLDFGIAKFADEQASRELDEATGEALCAFSPFYAAPEQFDRDLGPTGPWTDVFSLALVLVEVASGRAALEGQSLAQLFRAASDEENRPTLRARGVDCSEAVDEVVRRATSPRPEARFATALDFWQALTQAAGPSTSRSLEATPPSPSLRRLVAEPEPVISVSGDNASEPPGAAAATGEHPASDGSTTPSGSTPRPARPRRRGERVGHFVALASGAALALAATYRGPLPNLHAATAPSLNGLSPLASHLDTSAVDDLGSRVLSGLDRALPNDTPSALTAGLHPAGASPATSPPNKTPPPAETEGAGDFTLRELGREALLDSTGAARACAKAGMALCTEAQWQLACSTRSPESTPDESWLVSSDPAEGAVVRGGPTGCGARQARPASSTLRTAGQVCCAPALVSDLRPRYTPASLPTPTLR